MASSSSQLSSASGVIQEQPATQGSQEASSRDTEPTPAPSQVRRKRSVMNCLFTLKLVPELSPVEWYFSLFSRIYLPYKEPRGA